MTFVLMRACGRAILVAVVAATSLVFAGCGGEAKVATGGADDVFRFAKVTNNTFKYAIVEQLPEGSLRRLAEELNTAVDQGLALQPTLDRIARSDDPYGQALADAMCMGLGQVASIDEKTETLPTKVGWDEFMLAQARVLLPNNPVDVVDGVVRRFTATANLASISPQLAIRYYQECNRR